MSAPPPIPRPTSGTGWPAQLRGALRVSRFELRIAAALVLAATLPLVFALLLADRVAAENLALGLDPRVVQQLQRTREYIAAASGASRQSGSRSVLGAVASFLLREPDAESDVHLFRSDPFTRNGLLPR